MQKRGCLFVLAGFLVGTLWAQSVTPSGPLSYTNQSNVVIQNKVFTAGGANGAVVFLSGCSNFTIKNCIFRNVPGAVAIQLSGSNTVKIQGCTFDSVKTGVYAVNCTGRIVIQCNSFKDIVGPKPRGQMVQFNGCSGPGNRILSNVLEQTPGAGFPEDLVNLYNSSGTTTDPIQVSGNKTRGGGPSSSGGGLMLGDNGSQNIIADNNILVNPGQYGISAPSGQNITISNNSVYSASYSYTNVGLYVGLASEVAAGFACVGSSISVTGNKVNWKNRNNVQNDFYFCSCCPGITTTGNTSRAAISASLLPVVLQLDNTCASLGLDCTVLGSACPAIALPIEIKAEAPEPPSPTIDLAWHVSDGKLLAQSMDPSEWQLSTMEGKILYQATEAVAIEKSLAEFGSGIYMLLVNNGTAVKVVKIYYPGN